MTLETSLTTCDLTDKRRSVVIPGIGGGQVIVTAVPLVGRCEDPGLRLTVLLSQPPDASILDAIRSGICPVDSLAIVAVMASLHLRYEPEGPVANDSRSRTALQGCARPVRATLIVEGVEVQTAMGDGVNATVDLAVLLTGSPAIALLKTALRVGSTEQPECTLRSVVEVWTQDGNERATVRATRDLRELCAGSEPTIVWTTMTPTGTIIHATTGGQHQSRRARETQRVAPTVRVIRSSPRSDMDEPGTVLRSAGAALRVGRGRVSAEALLSASSNPINTLKKAAFHHVVLDDLVIAPKQQAAPLIDDQSGSVFTDYVDPSRHWFVPELAIATPLPNDDVDTRPFRFVFERAGTILGSGGVQQGLRGTVTVTARRIRPANAPDGAEPVPLHGLSASLEIPYRNAADGATHFQSFPAVLQADGDRLTCTIELLDDWVRLAYGALSVKAFQAEPPRVRISYAFLGYTEVDLGGGTRPDLFIVPALALKPLEPDRWKMSAVRDRDIANMELGSVLLTKFKPIIATLPRRQFAIGTHVRQIACSAVFPCAELGDSYRERSGETFRTVGCVDALQLGVITPKLYDEVVALRSDRMRVWRSLTQPSRFLAVPATYRIARRDEDADAAAFRPAIHISGAVDAAGDVASYLFQAVLQPDVSAVGRERLNDALHHLVPVGDTPVVDWPTSPAVQAEFSTTWATSTALPVPTCVPTWEGIGATINCALVDALLLNDVVAQPDGLTGVATFRFPDGSSVTSRLALDTRPCGPWKAGPVAVAISGTTATLTNRIERPVTVLELLARPTANGSAVTVPVARELAPGEEITVAVPAGTTAAVADAVPDGGALAISESNVFAQDVSVQIVALNQCDLVQRAIDHLTINVRFPGATPAQNIRLDSVTPTATVQVTLPITTYLEPRSFEWQVTITRTDTATDTGPWRAHSLSTEGGLIAITPESLPTA